MTACPHNSQHADSGLPNRRHPANQTHRGSPLPVRADIPALRRRGLWPPLGHAFRRLSAFVAVGTLFVAGRAQVTYSGPPSSSSSGPAWSRVPGLTQDMLVVLGVGGLLLIMLLIWALFLRKKPRSHSHSRHRSAIHIEESSESDSDHARHHHRHRRKRRRREHRTRNPTLAETGGLPPPRSEPQPPPAT